MGRSQTTVFSLTLVLSTDSDECMQGESHVGSDEGYGMKREKLDELENNE